MSKPVYMKKYPHLFEPLEIPIAYGKNKLVLKNKLMQAPMAFMGSGDGFGRPLPEKMQFYLDMAKGGFGMVTIPAEIPKWDMHERILALDDNIQTYLDFHRPMKVIIGAGQWRRSLGRTEEKGKGCNRQPHRNTPRCVYQRVH